MNPHHKNFRRWLAIAWLASGVILCWNNFSWAKPDGQTTIAPGTLIIVDDKLYAADFRYREIVKPMYVTCDDSRLVHRAENPGNAIGFTIDDNGQLTLARDLKSEVKLKRHMLEDTRNPKLNSIDLRASSYHYKYALQAEVMDATAPAAKAVVIAEESVEVSLTSGQKITARPVLLRVLRKGDAYLKFEVNYTSGK